MQSLRFLYPILLHFFFFILLSSSSSSVPLCKYHQSSALLRFKNSFSLDSEASLDCDGYHNYSYPKTASWLNGSDCCLWHGVTCDTNSGYVIGLDLSCSWLQGTFHQNSTLFQLTHLQTLNLAFNNFDGSPMPSHFGGLETLTYLNLSQAGFVGKIPSKISHLSKLTSLDLSWDSLGIEPSTWKKLTQNATDLRELDFTCIDMSSIKPSSLSFLLNLSSSLVSLSLHSTGLKGNLLDNILRLPNLQKVDLSFNQYLKVHLPNFNWSTPLKNLNLKDTKSLGENLPESISHLKSLRYLALSNFDLPGTIPSSFGNLKQLTHLLLLDCNLQAPIPPSFWNLTQLTYLDLRFNNFNCQIPSSLSNFQHLTMLFLDHSNFIGSIPNMFVQLNKLNKLYISNNNLHGPIPNTMFELINLNILSLSLNNLTGHFELLQFSKLQSLKILDLSYNRFLSICFNDCTNQEGPIPNIMFDLVNLTVLRLSSTNLSGHVKFHQFSKLKNLQILDLSHNKFFSISFDNSANYTVPNIQSLLLSSNNINITFSKIIAQLKYIEILDLSNNKIHGRIPKWLNDVEIDYLYSWNLSHNMLTSAPNLSRMNIDHLDLSHNLLQGDLPIPPSSTWFFSVSNNNLTGEISTAICKASSLGVLNLSYNNLTGPIPQCLGNFSVLSVLDLHMNHLSGTLPAKFSKKNSLETLKLNGNNLEGPLPRSLAQCKQLQVLDVGENNINDTFPGWLDALPELQVLILRANKFHGIISKFKTKHPFPKLRIFDVSNNFFNGPLPKAYIKFFRGMMNVGNGTIGLQYMTDNTSLYYDSVVVTMKGFSTEFEKILTIFTTIDFSNNLFEGQIPKVTSKLSSLKGLNISHNRINGNIPHSLGNLTSLEWLDLSSNKLKGEIPMALTNLNFLEALNLSQNQLEGVIPRGKQFDTFSNESYAGNSKLCGLPLSKKCNKDEERPPSSSTSQLEKEESGFGWKAVALGYGCGFVFGMMLGYLVFTGKPEWLVILFGGDTNKVVRRRMRNRGYANRMRRN